MTFSRIQAPPGFGYNGNVSSGQFNQLDIDHSNSLDKRLGSGDTVLSNVAFDGYFSVSTLSGAPITIGIQTPLSNLPTSNITLTSQAPMASATGANKNTGNIILNFPAPISGGTHGSLEIQDGGNTLLTIQSTDGSAITSTATNSYDVVGTFINLNASVQANISGASITMLGSATGLIIDNTSGQIDFTNQTDTTIYFSLETISQGFNLVYPSATGIGNSTQINAQNSTGSVGGNIEITAGSSTVSVGGNIYLAGGQASGSSQVGGNISLTGGLGGTSGAGGNVTISGGIASSGTTGNIALGHGTASYGGGANVIFIANATASPNTNPVAGGVLYISNGALVYRGSSGSVTGIAPA